MQCCGSGSVRIRNFLQDPDPLLEVMDPDPDSDPKLDLNLTKTHQKKISNLIIMTFKNINLTLSLKNML
jgi:hypothetical protein